MTPRTPAMTPRARAAAVLVGTLAASALLRRSRVARLGAIGALGATAYGRFARREPRWHDVEPPR